MTPRRKWTMIGLSAALFTVAGVGLFGPPLIIRNITPSVRMGFYRLSLAEPGEGRLILFPAPEALQEYAPAAGAELKAHLLIKPVIAGPGRRVCASAGAVDIEGVGSFAQAQADARGNPLPQYRDCRRLQNDELFAISTRVPNSLDSRYFGPVSRASVRGVYVPLWTPDFMQ